MRRAAIAARSMAPALLVALVVLGCDIRGNGPSATRAVVATSPPVATAGATVEASPVATLPGQSEAEWGRIWDILPATFPVPGGASAAEPDTGPVSAAFTVPVAGSTAQQVADFYRAGLVGRGYSTSVDGPLEDGSFTVDSSNGAGCRVLVTILPRGDESFMSVLYGVGCAFE